MALSETIMQAYNLVGCVFMKLIVDSAPGVGDAVYTVGIPVPVIATKR